MANAVPPETARLARADRLSYAAARAGVASGLFAWRRYVVVAVPLARAPAMPRGWTWAVADPAGLGDLATSADGWRAGQAMSALVVAPGGRPPVAVTWVGGGFDEDEAHLRWAPPPGCVWDTGMFVAPAARGGRAFAALWAATAAFARAGWSMSRVADYNRASRAAHARLGAVEVARVAVMRVGRWQRAWGAEPAWTSVDGPRAVPALVRP